MLGSVILISNDSDFFEYIIPKLSLRNSDSIFRFCFNELPEKFYLLSSSLLIINAENNTKQTLQLMQICKGLPVIAFNYKRDNEFAQQAYQLGLLSYITMDTSDTLVQAQIVSVLKTLSLINKNSLYRDILVNKHLIAQNNEVFYDSNIILELELEKIHNSRSSCVALAIAPDDNSKFKLSPNKIETIILNNIRQTDLLINFAPNKYFLILHNITIDNAKHIWSTIANNINEPIYAGITTIENKNRQLLINELLNKLHEAINNKFSLPANNDDINIKQNFKFYRAEFRKKIDKIISPVFYHIKQKYDNNLYGVNITIGCGDGYSVLYLQSSNVNASLRITSPGFSTINIDIEYNPTSKNFNSDILIPKRVTLEPEKLEEGFLQDLLEQFIIEFKTALDL